MPRRPIKKLRPGLEPLEGRRTLSAAAAASVAAAGTRQLLPTFPDSAQTPRPFFGYLAYRVTNPNRFNNHLTPPFGHVLVQLAQPVPGQVYNVLYVAMRNGTSQTFDTSSNFAVKFPGQPFSFPILTGNQQWKPGQWYIFYVLTKKYYPMPNVVTSGYGFNLGGAISVAIPGPSGIFLRLRYNPATIDRNLDAIVTRGQGAEGGVGIKYGLPDTAIYEFVNAKTNRNDYGGYF
jgi:hypothetical protein